MCCWKEKTKTCTEFPDQDFIVSNLFLTSARSQSSMPPISLHLSPTLLSLHSILSRWWVEFLEITPQRSCLYSSSGALGNFWKADFDITHNCWWRCRGLSLPFSPLTGSWGNLGRRVVGVISALRLHPPTNPSPQQKSGGPQLFQLSVGCRGQSASRHGRRARASVWTRVRERETITLFTCYICL